MRTLTGLLIAVFVLTGGTGALAQGVDITVEQQKLLAKRAAEADAYRKLAETVYGLQINERTYVKDYVTESDDIRGEVDAFIKGVRLGEPRFFDDGSCEVPAEVTVAKVVETLRSSHSRYYKGNDVKVSDFESMSRRIEKKVIRAVGHGAPRPDLPPDLPLGAAELLGPPPASPPPAVPDLWKSIGPQARLSAMRAARMDALRRLAERIKGLRLTARTQVRDFVTESDEIRAEMNAYLVGAEEKGYYLHHNELIAECTMVVPTEQVVETIKKLYSRHYKGDDIKGSEIEQITRTVVKRDFEATGMGVPNPRFIRRAAAERPAAPLPDWSQRVLEVEGRGTDPQMDTPQGKLRAARAAEMDARRKLAEQIAGLRLQGETTVRDFVTERDEISARVDAVIVDAVVADTRFEGETAIVRIALPGVRVWSVISDGLRQRTP